MTFTLIGQKYKKNSDTQFFEILSNIKPTLEIYLNLKIKYFDVFNYDV